MALIKDLTVSVPSRAISAASTMDAVASRDALGMVILKARQPISVTTGIT